MRFLAIMGICLLILLPLISATSYESITTNGVLQDYKAENIYLVAPDSIHFGENFSIIIGIEVNSNISKTRDFYLDGTLQKPVISGVNTPEGKSFAIYEWNITPWNNQFLTLRGLMNNSEFFRKEINLNLKKKVVVNSKLLSSKIINLSKTPNDSISKARIALAGKNSQYSVLEFNQMIKFAKERYDLSKRVDKVLETYEDNTSKVKTIVTISLDSKKAYGNAGVDIIEIIPKDVVSDAKMIKSSPLAFVLKKDPIIMWHVTGSQKNISYEIEKDVAATGNTVMVSSLSSNKESKQTVSWRIIGPLLVIPLIAGVIVFFARFEPKSK